MRKDCTIKTRDQTLRAPGEVFFPGTPANDGFSESTAWGLRELGNLIGGALQDLLDIVSGGRPADPIPGDIVTAETEETPRPSPEDIHVTEERKEHILEGDGTGGGHRPGTGFPGKSEFPVGWSDERIIDAIVDVAKDPESQFDPAGGHGDRVKISGTRDGIDIDAIVNPNGSIHTGFPTNVPRNPW